MNLAEFVQDQFGKEAAKKLLSIRSGGDNNQKGGLYEDFFAVSQICAIAATEQELDRYEISSQELAFVDDLCIRDYLRNKKTNYQAKNSSGEAATWTPDIEERFGFQCYIDKNFFNVKDSFQVLLVSSEDKANSNQNKIPANARGVFLSEFFPYQESSVRLILDHRRLRSNLELICDSNDLSNIDSAFRILLGVWRSDQAPRTVKDIFSRARKDAKPDLFLGLISKEIIVPEWLINKCSEFEGIEIHPGAGRYIVNRNGYAVSIPANVSAPDPDVLDEITTLEEFFRLLMSLAIPELIN
ncbi:hypothetical protein [Allochromatium vinosum]|uniref:hypothetical protein n=1 Tax=Allochromatium vinosum TaxID=1049 RepID=UPI001903CA6F|nr:hypothetical protein [Allochromatium vinosum]